MDPQAHKQFVTSVFDKVATGYDNPSQRFFQYSGDYLVKLLRPKPGSKVLDIAAGTGATTIAFAQAIGPQGRVQAIDLSENMLDKAFANLQRSGLTNVDFHVMDAEQLDFKSRYFDIAVCAFGVFFLPDMLKAVKEWYRVLKPGSKLAFTTFSLNAFQPLAEMFRNTMQQDFNQEFPKESWQRLAKEEDCKALLSDAGFSDISVHTAQMGYHLKNEQDWWEIITNSGFRAFLDKLDAKQQAEFRLQHLADVQKLKTDKGIWLDIETHFSIGQRRNKI